MEINKKYKVIGLNILFSQAIILSFLLFTWIVWYPSPFYEISNISKIAQAMIFANICLGPLLVFIIYKKDKKHLNLDLSILATIQLSAFLFAAYSVYLKHPSYAVFTIDRFTLVSATSISTEKIKYPQLATSFFSAPKIVFAKRPDTSAERNSLLFGVLFQGEPDLDRRAEYYEPFLKHLSTVLERSIDTNTLFPDSASQLKLKAFLNKHGGNKQDYAYFPLQGNVENDLIWVLDRKLGNPIGTIDSDPWQIAKK